MGYIPHSCIYTYLQRNCFYLPPSPYVGREKWGDRRIFYLIHGILNIHLDPCLPSQNIFLSDFDLALLLPSCLLSEYRSHLFFLISWDIMMHYSGPLPFSPTRHMVLHRAHISEDDLSVTAENRFTRKTVLNPKLLAGEVAGGHRTPGSVSCLPPPLPSKVKDREREGRRAQGPMQWPL